MLHSIPTHITYAEHHTQIHFLDTVKNFLQNTMYTCYVLDSEHKHSDKYHDNGFLECNTL